MLLILEATDLIRINFAMHSFLMNLNELNLYNLDVLNLLNLYNTESAKGYRYGKIISQQWKS